MRPLGVAGTRSLSCAIRVERYALSDTLLTTGAVPSLPFLSVQPQQQRRWGSL